MASPSTAVLVRMLEPWLVCARTRLDVSITDPFTQPDKQPVWAQWIVREGGELTVEDVEAMEMLELLARVDFHAAWKLMLEMTEEAVYLDQIVDAEPSMGDPEAVYVRYIIVGLHHTVIEDSLKPILRLLLLEIDPENHSPMYYAVRQTLLQCCADRHDEGRVAPFARAVDHRIQLKLEIDFSGLQARVAERLMDEVAIAALMNAHPDRLQLYPSWQQVSNRTVLARSGVFKLHAMALEFDSATITDAMVLSTKSVWEDTDVIVDSIEFDSTIAKLSPVAATEYFRTFLNLDTEGTTPSTLTLCAGGTMVEFGAACSAVATSQGLKSVCFDIYDGDNRLFWAWIAYTMFSCDAAHKILSLRIDATNLTQECVDVFERVRTAQDPLAVLWRYHNGQFDETSKEQTISGGRSVVEVNPRTTLLLVNERGRVRSGNHVETLRVVDDSTENQHVCVLYPGAGMCWVHRSQIICRRAIEPSSPTESAITDLCLDVYSNTKIDALTELLSALASSQLETCEVFSDDGVFVNDYFFSRLLQVCPHLNRLDLVSIEVTNFDWLKVSVTKLRSLSIRDVKTRRQDSYKRILSAIASANASALVELHLQLPAKTLENLMTNIERMLQRNRLMERVLLSVDDNELKKSLAERIQKQSGGLLATQRAPLPLKSKLAFISCSNLICTSAGLDHSEPLVKMEHGESRAVLDAGVIACIFRFAAPCKRRVCGFIGSRGETSGDSDEEFN